MIHRNVVTATFISVVLSGSGAVAADKEKVHQAVDRGIEHLRALQNRDGSWPAHYVGGTALAGLTLLECGVPPDDPAVKQAAEYLRKSWTDVNDEYTTYAISLAILFFDRLGDPADTPIIQALGVRLLAGQNTAGGWTYMCPPLGAEDLRQLKAMVEHQVELKTKNELPKVGAKPADDKRVLPKEFKQILGRLEQKGIPPEGQLEMMLGGGGGDNSNTQFAILGLWAARRYGVPGEKALARAENRFRTSQNGDGGWGYMPGAGMRGLGGFGGSTGSMTCAGLLGLAAGLGSAREASMRTVSDIKGLKTNGKKTGADPAKDPVIQNGLNALARIIGEPLRDGRPGFAGGNGRGRMGPLGQGREGNSAVGLGDMYYLLWSIERVAVAYSLSTIGKKDWYAWGSELLLDAQQADGGWTGKFSSGVDTSFALLFLRRANLARDLTAFLKGRNPMEVALKGGGVMEPAAEKERAGDDGMKREGERAKERAGEEKEKSKMEDGGSKIEDRASKTEDRSRGHRSSIVAPPSSKAKTPEVPFASPIPGSGAPVAPSPSRPLAPSLPEDEAARLGVEFLKASGSKQEELLEQLKQTKGGAYTAALAGAIDQLSGPLKTKAREALAERLARMTTATLQEMLHDAAPEIRRAASLACAIKEEKHFIPELAKLLEDSESAVVRAAYGALKALTGEDFGPSPNASLESRRRAAAAYMEWWEKQSAKKEPK
jgi:hypothetical protein